MNSPSPNLGADAESSDKLSANQGNRRQHKPRRWWKLIVSTLVFSILLIAVLPSIIANRLFRNRMLAAALADKKVAVTVDLVQLSWFAPLTLTQLRIMSKENESRASVQHASTDNGLFDWLFRPGTSKSVIVKELSLLVDVEKPTGQAGAPIDYESTELEELDADSTSSIAISLRDGQVWLTGENLPQPTIVLEHMDLDGQLVRSDGHTQFVVEPGKVIDRGLVSAEICDAAIKYIAPVLAEAAWAEGTLSLELDHCRVSLGNPQATQCGGKLTIESLRAGLESPLAVKIGELLSGMLGEDLPSKIKLADNSQVAFAVRDGRVWHDGLEFGLPDISPDLLIRTRGTVGLDQTLDLVVDVPLPLHLLGEGPVAKALGHETLSLTARGTLDEPEFQLHATDDLLTGLLGRLSRTIADGDIDLTQLVERIRDSRGRRDSEALTVFDRLRQRRQQRLMRRR